MTRHSSQTTEPVSDQIDWVLRCAYLVSAGDAHLAEEEKIRLRSIRGEVGRMLQAREAIERAEQSGDLKEARSLFDVDTPVVHSFGDMLAGMFEEELGSVGLPSSILPLHELRGPITSQKSLAELERSVARETGDPFLHRVAYYFSIEVAGADDDFSDGEQQSLRGMAEEWNLTHSDAVDWYNDFAFPILTGQEPERDVVGDDAEHSGGPGEAIAALLAAAGDDNQAEVLAELLRLAGDGDRASACEADEPPLVAAIETGDISVVKDALDEEPDLSNELFQGVPLLTHAVLAGQFEIARELLARGSDINLVADGRATALALAAMNGQAAGVEFCLDHGADPNQSVSISISGDGGEDVLIHGITPLHLAASVENPEIIKILLRKGADLNSISGLGFSPLMHSIKDQQYENAVLLIDAGAAIDFDPPAGLPVEHLARLNPLLVAATNENLPMIRLLLQKKVRIDIQDGGGSTALKHAATAGNRAMVEALIKAGANVNLADEENWTPLMSAAYREHGPIVRTLLDNGADPNVRATDRTTETAGWTPLIAAAAYGCDRIVELLLNANASRETTSSDGLTALEHAVRNGEISGQSANGFKRTIELLQPACA